MLSATRFSWLLTCWRFSTVCGVMVGLRGFNQLPNPTARMRNNRRNNPHVFSESTILTGTPIGLIPLDDTTNIEQVPVKQRARFKPAGVPMKEVATVGGSRGFVDVVLLGT